jgi:hypothetical protein
VSNEAVVDIDVDFPKHDNVLVSTLSVGKVVKGEDNGAVGGVFERDDTGADGP